MTAAGNRSQLTGRYALLSAPIFRITVYFAWMESTWSSHDVVCSQTKLFHIVRVRDGATFSLMGAIHKMAATLGDFPTARALRGNFSSRVVRRIWPSTSLLVFSSSCGQKSLIQTKIFPARHPLLVTMLIFAFTGLRYRIKA